MLHQCQELIIVGRALLLLTLASAYGLLTTGSYHSPIFNWDRVQLKSILKVKTGFNYQSSLKVLTTGVLPVKAHDIHDNHRLLSYHDNHRLLSYSNNDIYDTIICQYYCTSLFRLVEDAIEQFRHVNALTCELLVSFITFMLLSGLIYTPQDF